MKSWPILVTGVLLVAAATQWTARAALPADDPAWAKAVDLLKVIQPAQNTVWGKWRMEQGGLQCEDSGSARLEIPYSLPDEYDFRIRFTPISGRHEIRQIMAMSGHQFLWSMGADGKSTYGVGSINGKKPNENRTTIKDGPALEQGVVYESIVQVRKEGLKIFLNGKLLTQWKTDYQDMSMVKGWELHNNAWLGLGAYQGCVRFHRVDLLEVTGHGQVVLTSSTTDSAGARGPTVEIPDAAWTKAVHLMPMIDPALDTVAGQWKKVNGNLIAQAERRGDAILAIPYEPPAEYDFRVTFTRSGGNGVTQIITQGGRAALWWMGGWANKLFGFERVDGSRADDNRTKVTAESCLEDNRRYTSVVQVRKTEIKAFVDGKFITAWKRKPDYSDASLPPEWDLSNPKLLGIGCHKNTTVFHAVDVLEVEGKGQSVAHFRNVVLPPSPAPRTTSSRTTEKAAANQPAKPVVAMADIALQKEARQFARNQSSIKGMFVMYMGTGQRLGDTQDIIATMERVHTDQETTADFVGNVASDMRISMEEAVRLLKVRYPVWQAGRRIQFSFENKYGRLSGGSAGGAFALLLLSLLEGMQIDSEFAITGDVTVDGKIRKVSAVPEKIHGALLEKCKIVALPAANKENISDLIVLHGPAMLWQVQLFAVENLDQAAALARPDRPDNLAKAIARFAELQKSFGPQTPVTALRAPATIQALQEVLKLAPNHLSAEFMLLGAQGQMPATLTLSSSLEETYWSAAPLLPLLFREEEAPAKKANRKDEWHMPDEVFQAVNERLTWLASRIHPKAKDLHLAMIDYVAALKVLGRPGVTNLFPRQQYLTKRDKLLGESLKLGADRKVLEELIH